MLCRNSRVLELGVPLGPLLQQESEVVVTDLDLLCQTLVHHLKLYVVPRELSVAKQVFVHRERPDLVLQGLPQLLTGLLI